MRRVSARGALESSQASADAKASAVASTTSCATWPWCMPSRFHALTLGAHP